MPADTPIRAAWICGVDGIDVSAADSVGDFKVSRAGCQASIGEKLAELKLPTVFVQEGGYQLEDIGGSRCGRC